MIREYGLMLNNDRMPMMTKEAEYPYQADRLDRPDVIVDMMNNCLHLKDKCEEYVYLLSMNTALSSPFALFQISHGTCNNSFANGREIIQRVLMSGGTGLVLVHNHPSGNPEPSDTDKMTCDKLDEACRIVGIEMYDFIIIGNNRYFSFREEGILH